jgi:hypothetical protein
MSERMVDICVTPLMRERLRKSKGRMRYEDFLEKILDIYDLHNNVRNEI